MANPQQKAQFHFVQALRGIAALWVVLFHIHESEYIEGLTAMLPKALTFILFEIGSSGVAIFFVLSGLVITHSVVVNPMNGRDLLHFGLRRSVRLDPPYWAAIALALSVTGVMARVHGETTAPPSFAIVAAHMLYLQEVMQMPRINMVFWTLTYEFQFYIVLAIGHWLASRFIARGTSVARAQFIVGAPLAMLALLAALAPSGWAPQGLFVNLWHAFFLGVLAYLAGYRRQSVVPLCCVAAATLVGAADRETLFGVPAVMTAFILFLSGRSGYLLHGMSHAAFGFLGRISYSLYLTHVPLMIIVFGAWGRLAGRSALADLAGFGFGLVLLVLGGYAFWWVIERPSQRLSANLFRRYPVLAPVKAIDSVRAQS